MAREMAHSPYVWLLVAHMKQWWAVSGQAMGATPDLTVEQSTERHLKLIGKLTKEDNGKYFSAAEDKELPY